MTTLRFTNVYTCTVNYHSNEELWQQRKRSNVLTAPGDEHGKLGKNLYYIERHQNFTMTKDRLCELKQLQGKKRDKDLHEEQIILDSEECLKLQTKDVELNLEDSEEYFDVPHSPILEALFKVYSEILEEFDLIRRDMHVMRNMVLAKNAKNFNEREFYKIRNHTVQTANKIMGKFQTIECNLPAESDFRTIARMKRILYYGIFQRYVEIWTDTERFLQDYEATMKKKLRAQSRILDISLTEEEIETLVSNKETNLYACNILEDTENARKTLKALTDRLGELQKLEKSIEQVHTLFIRLQQMVVEQGAVMQSIEKHYRDAQEFVEVATEDIGQTRRLVKSNLKKRIIIALIIVVLILMVILLILLL